MADSEFVTEAIAAGFTRQQAVWLEENVAEEGHGHDIEDIDGLADALDADVDDTDEEASHG